MLIPTGKKKEVTEVESFNVTWYIKKGWSDETVRNDKVFINKEESEDFRRQLEDCAGFIKCWIKIEINKN